LTVDVYFLLKILRHAAEDVGVDVEGFEVE